jgi:drug/metabolite transporter (DMT)-like permease
LTIIAVPVLSFFIFGERLSVFKYAGMLVVLLGATLLSLNVELRKDFSVKYLKIMLGAVLFLSLSIILEGRAYDLLNETYGAQGFWTGFFFFSLGASTAGLLFALYFQRSPLPLIQKYYKIFIIGEGIYFLGNLFSQKALDIAPSVSYVAAIESFIPVFVLAYSLLILFFFSSILKKENQAVKSIYSEQIKGLWFKIPATIIMALGIYIIS